jgi:glycosyltransferase involved in cell wall biosynthesis
MTPLLPVSIVIPCRDAAATLPRTLESCLGAAHVVEILVVDDASSDDSLHVVRRYQQRDARIVSLRMPVHGGSARARNWGVLHASQPVVAFIDADDEYLPGALTAASRYLADHPHDASIRLDVEYAGFPSEILAHPEFERLAATLSNTVPSSLVIYRAVFLAIGGFPVDGFFRVHGGYDGAFSWALSRVFGNPRLVDAKRVRMHHHAHSHAARFFRINMDMETPDPADVLEAVRLSRQFVATVETGIEQLLAMRKPARQAT